VIIRTPLVQPAVAVGHFLGANWAAGLNEAERGHTLGVAVSPWLGNSCSPIGIGSAQFEAPNGFGRDAGSISSGRLTRAGTPCEPAQGLSLQYRPSLVLNSQIVPAPLLHLAIEHSLPKGEFKGENETRPTGRLASGLVRKALSYHHKITQTRSTIGVKQPVEQRRCRPKPLAAPT
jgi:hypothetical protein